ncbi:MAG: hypothetical protein J2P17_35030, partial [Mycobacterium sp.]|nr:hypothetical protein [Mycobacterium sp.]
ITYASFGPEREADFITGAWRYLMLGVRSDIRYAMSTEGVIKQSDGTIAVSAFQDNVTLLKVWARFACVLVKPVTRRQPEGASPFAMATLVNGGSNGGQTEPNGRTATATREPSA